MTTSVTAEELRALLDDGDEIAVVDVRAPQARSGGHIAVSSGLPLHELEQRIGWAVPHRSTRIVLASEPDLDRWAARILDSLGYTDVAVLTDGLDGWVAAGGRLYTGTNVRSKTLGEWIEKHFGTATVDAATVAGWRDAGEDLIILDSRPRAEYRHHHIPGGYDTGGGAELAYRGLALIDKPDTKIIVNCAGRTRGIVGAQSIINTGINNPVYSLHNGTPAWEWAGQRIENGTGNPLDAQPPVSEDLRRWAGATLDAAGATTIDASAAAELLADASRTTYVIDVRTPEEFAAGTVSGARLIQGGQLVQATDEHIAVRGARIILVDTADHVRAASTVQWLHYLHNGPVHVIDAQAGGADTSTERAAKPIPLPDVPVISGAELAAAIQSDTPPVIYDLRGSLAYEAGHLPGAVHTRREHLAGHAATSDRIVLVGDGADYAHGEAQDLQSGAAEGYQPHFAAQDLIEQGYDVRVLVDGPDRIGIPLTTDDARYAADIADRVGPPPFGPARDAWYREYFDWEYALLANSDGDPDFDFDGKAP